MLTSLITDQEILASIPCTAVEFFSSRELIIPRYLQTECSRVLIHFVHILPLLSSEKDPGLCFPQVMADPPVVSVALCGS